MSDTESFDAIMSDFDGDPESMTTTAEPEAAPSSAPSPAPADPSSAADPAPPRDDKGRFAPKTESVEAPEQPTPAEAPAPDAAQTQEPGETIAEQPNWQEFVVTNNRESVLNDVHLLVENGHAMLVTPEGQLPRIQQLLSRGRQYEVREREFSQREAQMAARENAPRPPSDSEIEAQAVLDYLKPVLPQILNEHDLRWLEDKVARARAEAQLRVRQDTEQYQQRQQEEAQSAEFPQQQLGLWVEDLAGQYKDRLSGSEIQQLLTDLTPYAPAFLQQTKKDGPFHDRFVFRNDLLAQEFEKRAKMVTEQKSLAQKAQKAAQFNARTQQPGTPAPAKRGAVTAKPKEKPKGGKETFDQIMKDWNKRPDLSFGDDDE